MLSLYVLWLPLAPGVPVSTRGGLPAAAPTLAQLPDSSIYRLKATRIDGTMADLEDYAGRVTVVVNVAIK